MRTQRAKVIQGNRGGKALLLGVMLGLSMLGVALLGLVMMAGRVVGRAPRHVKRLVDAWLPLKRTASAAT